jgi:hypothetical protein
VTFDRGEREVRERSARNGGSKEAVFGCFEVSSSQRPRRPTIDSVGAARREKSLPPVRLAALEHRPRYQFL